MYYLGVDGGGTKTTAALTNAHGELVKKVELGAGNIAVLGAVKAQELIQNLIKSLINKNDLKKITWATFAFAGLGREKEKKVLMEIVDSFGINNFSVMTDAEILYYSIFEERTGILIAAGTGAICLIREKRKFKQIGGWGYLLGDEGSGFDIGRQAIRKMLAEQQANKPISLLTKQLLIFFGVRQTEDLVSLIYEKTNPQNTIASCAELVCEQYHGGDSDAVEIITCAAKSLLQLVLTAVGQIKSPPPYELALSGSILKDLSAVNIEFKRLIQKEQVYFKYTKQNLSSVAAALLNSVKMDTDSVSKRIIMNLQKI